MQEAFMKPRVFTLDVVSKGIQLKLQGKVLGCAKTAKGLVRLVTANKIDENRDAIMCSSSLDFPKEYTSDKGVIALARKIRS
jgi:hypothetical protein